MNRQAEEPCSEKDDQLILTQENRYNGIGQRISKAETKLKNDLNGETTETTKRNYYYQDGAVLYTKMLTETGVR
ncbi:MAG: hypothetical protein ACLVJQ_09010 [Lentihominibacter sp.]